MQKQVTSAQKDGIIITDTDMKTLQSEQRRLLSAHMKQQREKDARKKKIKQIAKAKCSQIKKQNRLTNLRKSEALKRKIAQEMCEGLPIPDSQGLDPIVQKVLGH